MDTFARRDKNLIMHNLDSIREGLISLMSSDQDFIDAIELSTSSKQAVNARFTKFQDVLNTILGITIKEPRCFSSQLKSNLYNANPFCTICNQRILNIDDSAVDHIEQYWSGGLTIPENARLTHRYCNNARSRDFNNSSVVKSQSIPVRSRSRNNNRRIIIIDGDKIYCNSSVEVLINTANWLIKKGKITQSKCPIKFQNGGSSYLINTRPYHQDGRHFFAGKELQNHIFLEGNWSTKDCIKWSKKLLLMFGISTLKFDLDE